MNENLVQYRINPYIIGDNHWDKSMKRLKLPRFYPWTVGFIEQIEELLNHNSNYVEVFKSAVGDHTFSHAFLEVDSMVELFLHQLLKDLTFAKYKYSVNDLIKFDNFLGKCRPDLVDLKQIIKTFLNYKQRNFLWKFVLRRKVLRDVYIFKKKWGESRARGPAQSLFYTKLNGYAIYKFDGHFICSVSKEERILDNVTVDLTGTANFYVSRNLEELRKEILKLPQFENIRNLSPVELADGKKYLIRRIKMRFKQYIIRVIVGKLN